MQAVAHLNAGFLSGAIDIDPLRAEVAAVLDPPNAIVGSKNFTLFFEINAGKNDRRNAEQREENGEKPRL